MLVSLKSKVVATIMKYKKLLFGILFFVPYSLEALPLRIVSFNCNWGIAWHGIRASIARMLKELNADIICLQEIPKKRHARYLAKKLGMHRKSTKWHTGGMAIIAKRTIQDFIVKDIPKLESNAFQNGVVAINIHNTWISCVHLTDLQYNISDVERIRELTYILDALYNKTKTSSGNIILAGDFNDAQEESAMSALLESQGFVDTHKNKPWQRGTWIPATTVPERIDRIYSKGPFIVKSGRVIDETNIPWLQRKQWITGADHRLIITELEMG